MMKDNDDWCLEWQDTVHLNAWCMAYNLIKHKCIVVHALAHKLQSSPKGIMNTSRLHLNTKQRHFPVATDLRLIDSHTTHEAEAEAGGSPTGIRLVAFHLDQRIRLQ